MIIYKRDDEERQNPAEALQTEGPCNVETPDGPFCAEPGMWLVYFPGNKPLVLTQAQFTAQFTE